MALGQKKGAAGPLCYLHAHLLREQITLCNGGGPGIRTPGTSRFNGFQDRRFRPLSQPTIIVPGCSGKPRALYRCARFYQDFYTEPVARGPLGSLLARCTSRSTTVTGGASGCQNNWPCSVMTGVSVIGLGEIRGSLTARPAAVIPRAGCAAGWSETEPSSPSDSSLSCAVSVTIALAASVFAVSIASTTDEGCNSACACSSTTCSDAVDESDSVNAALSASDEAISTGSAGASVAA